MHIRDSRFYACSKNPEKQRSNIFPIMFALVISRKICGRKNDINSREILNCNQRASIT